MTPHACTSGRLQSEMTFLKSYIDKVVMPMTSPELKASYLQEIQKYVTDLAASETKKQFAGPRSASAATASPAPTPRGPTPHV